MSAAQGDIVAELQRANMALTQERDAARAREVALAEVLDVINRSPGDPQPVFAAILANAHALCGARVGALGTYDGTHFQALTTHGYPAQAVATVSQPFPPSPFHEPLLRGARVYVPDTAAYEWTAAEEVNRAFLEQAGLKTYLMVPLRKDGIVVGFISAASYVVRPFAEADVTLLESFATQAVIAMENARLLTEQQEALERQTATAEVLQVINASPGNLAPVFDAMLERAMRLCGAVFGTLRTYEGEQTQTLATRDVPTAYAEYSAKQVRIAPDSALAVALAAGRPLQSLDIAESERYRSGDAGVRALVDLGRARTVIWVPLLKDGISVGLFTMYRQEVRAFTDKQIALLESFAAQAVIAMENARLLGDLRTRTDDLQESLRYQTATSDVLKAITRSTFDLDPVLDALLAAAARLCDADSGTIATVDGDHTRLSTHYSRDGNPVPGSRPGDRLPLTRSSIIGRTALEGRIIHVEDIGADPEHNRPGTQPGTKSVGTMLGVPLLRDGGVIGVICLARNSVRPFPERQIDLVGTFADQAVIAIENTRLVTEQQEALERQTATAEVLAVINASQGNLAPVFEAIIDKSLRLCGASFGMLYTRNGDNLIIGSMLGVPEAWAQHRAANPSFTLGPNTAIRNVYDQQRSVLVRDMKEIQGYQAGDPNVRALVDLGGVRTLLAVPLASNGITVGHISVYRQEVRAFSEQAISLLEGFAAQAVIAMENARLLTEQREALERQTAMAEVLGAINANPGNLAPVFERLLESALRLCGAAFGILRIFDGTVFHTAASLGVPPAYAEFLATVPQLPAPGSIGARIAAGEAYVHVVDAMEGDAYRDGEQHRRALVDLGGARTTLVVALTRDGRPVGGIQIYRSEVRAYRDHEIALVQSFAAQAVIAMENARLLGDLHARTDELARREDELRVTFENMGDGVAMFDEAHKLVAWNRKFQDILELPDDVLAQGVGFADYIRMLAARGEFGADADAESHVQRLSAGLGERRTFERLRPNGHTVEVRTNPVADGGFVVIYADITERKRAEAEIAAARDAAEQAARTIETAYRELKIAQANLVQAEKMASLGQLTAGIAHEIKNPLNFVNNFSDLSVELLGELSEVIAPAVATLGEDARADVDDLTATLTSNLQKITEHGRRADGIVRSMLEHSRGSSGERRSVDLNAVVEEALNLAYHGARAQDQSFNITLERHYAKAMAPITLTPQDITRVFLNLFNNGFYAASKRAKAGGEAGFAPTLTVTTRELGDAVEIRVRDNGTGIAPDIRDKLFQPFFTTKPTGEGTGLGLSITYDIVTKQHGGTIAVDSTPGDFTEFTVTLPRTTGAPT